MKHPPPDNFLIAHEDVARIEGGYSNDPKDRGGETYAGIARRFWPGWPGWEYIDEAKAGGPIQHGDKVAGLDGLVHEFYREHFWTPVGGHLLPLDIARELYEQSVNFGVHPTVCALQRACNAMNRGGVDWHDVKVDGAFGPNTLEAVNAAISGRGMRSMLTVLNVIQGARYLEIVERDASQERFFNGWMKRVSLGGGDG